MWPISAGASRDERLRKDDFQAGGTLEPGGPEQTPFPSQRWEEMSLLLRGSPQEVSAGRGLEGVSEACRKLLVEVKESSPSLLCWLFISRSPQAWPQEAMTSEAQIQSQEFGKPCQILRPTAGQGKTPGGVRSCGSALLLATGVTWMGSCTR